MDISTNKSVAEREEEGTLVHVKDAAGEPAYYGDNQPVTMIVAGTYSTTYRKAVAANRDKWLKRRSQQLDGDQLDRQSLETTAACVKAWDGFFSGATPVELNKSNAVALLDNAPWIREQVEGAMNDHASYFPNASAD